MKKTNKSKLSAVQKLSDKAGIPFAMAVTKLPYITMCSNREIIIEDSGKLVHYDTESVKVMQRKMTVSVCGKNLLLKCLANNDMRVCGYITSVSFE